MYEHTVSPICYGVVQLTKDFGLGTFGPQMVNNFILYKLLPRNNISYNRIYMSLNPTIICMVFF